MSAVDRLRPAERAHSMFAELPGDVAVSFEFFPPRNPEGFEQLRATLRQLEGNEPAFVSMTYGAGGSARDKTFAAIEAVRAEVSSPIAGHLTCAGASRDEVDAVARRYLDAGIRRIVALRGDGGRPGTPFSPHPQGYRNAAELVASLARVGAFDISVAAYPEVHPDAASAEADLDNLKRKLDAGASRALTQFFFAPDTFFRFRDRAAAAGITAPLVPGILPITSLAQVRRFAQGCGASLPGWIERLLEGLDESPATLQLVSAALSAELCLRLCGGGVREFHFYTLNRADPTLALCRLLGKQAGARLSDAA